MKNSIWHQNPAKFVRECKRLRALCQRIIAGEESIIEGSHKMLQYRFWMKEEANEAWTIFVTIDSESNHLPVGVARVHWNEQALRDKDREIAEVESFHADRVRSAALTIRNQYEQYVVQVDAGSQAKPGADP